MTPHSFWRGELSFFPFLLLEKKKRCVPVPQRQEDPSSFFSPPGTSFPFFSNICKTSLPQGLQEKGTPASPPFRSSQNKFRWIRLLLPPFSFPSWPTIRALYFFRVPPTLNPFSSLCLFLGGVFFFFFFCVPRRVCDAPMRLRVPPLFPFFLFRPADSPNWLSLLS